MFAFDTLNNEVKINLNPIYQAINGLSEDKLDKTEYANLFDGLFLESQKKLSNYLDRSREAYFMDAHEWTTPKDEPTPLNSGYYVAKSEQNAVLNYNNNVNYVENFTNIVNAALNEDNIYKDRIELTGNLNFTSFPTVVDVDIKTIVLKNKNKNNNFEGVYVINNNKIFDIDGFNKIDNLGIYDSPGCLKIKNCEEMKNIIFTKIKNIDIKNIGIINMTENTDEGLFIGVDNLKLKNVAMAINDNFYFNEIKNLNIDNATIVGKNNINDIFFDIKNAKFNNVYFNLDSLEDENKFVFNNALYFGYKLFNNFEFKNCFFNDDIRFAGINGLFENCSFGNLDIKYLNDLTFNIGEMGEMAWFNPITFKLDYSDNTININNFEPYQYILSATAENNIVNFNNKLNYEGEYSIVIDEGENTSPTHFINTYSFINNADNLTMYIFYGNDMATGSSFYKNPKIYLDKNNVISFNSPNNEEMKNNTFDVYFNDVFNKTNLDINNFRYKINTTPSINWSELNINTFNLYFNKDTLFDSAFYNQFVSLFGGGVSTNSDVKEKILKRCLKLFDKDGREITNFV